MIAKIVLISFVSFECSAGGAECIPGGSKSIVYLIQNLLHLCYFSQVFPFVICSACSRCAQYVYSL